MADTLQVVLSNVMNTPLGVTISDYHSLAYKQDILDYIALHNISLSSHEDIRDFIDTLSSTTTSAISSINAIYDMFNMELSSKIDKPSVATSGNLAIFNDDKNVIDSGINKQDIVVLDLSGMISQRYIPEVYVRNIVGDDIYHPLRIETNIYGENSLLIGVGVPLSSII